MKNSFSSINLIVKLLPDLDIHITPHFLSPVEDVSALTVALTCLFELHGIDDIQQLSLLFCHAHPGIQYSMELAPIADFYQKYLLLKLLTREMFLAQLFRLQLLLHFMNLSKSAVNGPVRA